MVATPHAHSKLGWLVASGFLGLLAIAIVTQYLAELRSENQQSNDGLQEAPPESVSKPPPIDSEVARARREQAKATTSTSPTPSDPPRVMTEEEMRKAWQSALQAERRKHAIDAIAKIEDNRARGYTKAQKTSTSTAELAHRDPTDPTGRMALYPGQLVPCVLEVDMVSDYIGGYTCTVQGDQRDITGKAVIVPDGSVVFGYYNRQSGNNQVINSAVQGKVLYITKSDGSGFLKPDQKGLTDQSGVPAVSGERDYHILAQAGALGVGALFTLASAMVPNTGGILSPQQDTLRNTAQAARTQANQVLNKFLSIEPTDTVPSGTLVNFMVQKPLYDAPVVQ
jgi:type IV secretory pathway VirB10-like protein